MKTPDQAVPVAVVEAVEGEAAAAGPSTTTSAAAAPGPAQLATTGPGPSSGSPAKTKAKKAGCRCGNATLCPGKLTCCGQRCPCYVDSLPCLDCKCKGCRNPHMPGGGKMRPVLPAIQNMKVTVITNTTHLSLTCLDPLISKLLTSCRLHLNLVVFIRACLVNLFAGVLSTHK